MISQTLLALIGLVLGFVGTYAALTLDSHKEVTRRVSALYCTGRISHRRHHLSGDCPGVRRPQPARSLSSRSTSTEPRHMFYTFRD